MIYRRTSDGALVRLGRELGRGGEGAVYLVPGEARVAKIYLKAPSAAKVEKLRAMTRAANPALLRVAAWPVDLLMDDSQRVRGFLMPRVDAREDVHELYSPRSRRRAFPGADFRFIVHAAANIARAFARVHAEGHVIGDVNHGNALIGKDATVVLIDCDSFQIRDGARVFTCDVGVPLFTAPELQNLGFRGLRRSTRHDAFGLGVLLFHLLFQGRHPFAGRFSEGDMPIERAIAESRFAYGARRGAYRMSPPPATLGFDTFGPRIAELFERSFAPPGEVQRPAAEEWIGPLEELARLLVPCAASESHFHPRAGHCCWCAMEASAGVRLFGPAPALEVLTDSLIDSLWNAIKTTPRPPRDPVYASPRGLPHKTPRWMVRGPRWIERWISRWPEGWTVGLLAILVLFGATAERLFFISIFILLLAGLSVVVFGIRRMIVHKIRKVMHARQLTSAESNWKRTVSRWNEVCSTALFNQQLDQLKLARSELAARSGVRRRAMEKLRREQQASAREVYLDGLRIDQADLGLSRSSLASLASFGYVTAADLIRDPQRLVRAIPMVAAKEVLDWAKARKQEFRFDGATIDPALVVQIEQRLAGRHRELLAILRDGPATLERTRQEILRSREALEPIMRSAYAELRAARDSLHE